jgi:hypothetical protein
MEPPMLQMRNRGAVASRLLVLTVSAVLGLAVAGGASAEFPYMNYGPSIIGTPIEGNTLQGSNGQWLYTSGLKCEERADECKYTYSWQRCNADVSGCLDIAPATATGTTLLLTSVDVGKRIRYVEWVFKHDCGEVNRQTGTQECRDVTKNGVSSPTAVVEPKPVTLPQAATPPTVQGIAMEDETLRATSGTWTGPAATSTQMYWQRCNTAGEGCVTIPNVTGPTYKIVSADIGARLRAIEAATNAGGTAFSPSTVTAVVVELRPTAFRQTVSVTKVSLPHRLVLDQVVTQQRGGVVTVRVRVGDDRGFRVSGVLVKAQPTGILSGSGAERLSNADGWATFTFKATGSGSSWLYVEARKRGEKAQSGISTANLFRVQVR